ncbi:hypothetical protein FACS1894198_3890 [Clostridia bacterium]|nr:hypothetical protein FACS1894198_3890 [Clostridia bacterium]
MSLGHPEFLKRAVYLTNLYYGGSYWIATAANGKIYSCSGNNPSGTWDCKVIAEGIKLNCSKYIGTKHIVLAEDGRMYYPISSISGDWASKKLDDSSLILGYTDTSTYAVIMSASGKLFYREPSNLLGEWRTASLPDEAKIHAMLGSYLVGEKGAMYYYNRRPIEIDWGTREIVPKRNMVDILHYNTRNVALTYDGYIYYVGSAVNSEWTARSLASGYTFNRLGTFNQGHIAITNSGTVFYTTETASITAWGSKVIASGVNLLGCFSAESVTSYSIITAANGVMYYISGSNMGATWTAKTIDSGVELLGGAFGGGEGYWIILGATGKIYYARVDDISGTWQEQTVAAGIALTGIGRVFSYYVATAENWKIYFCLGKSPAGQWDLKTLEDGTTFVNISSYDYVTVGTATGKIHFLPLSSFDSMFNLPNIHLNGVNTYIKT